MSLTPSSSGGGGGATDLVKLYDSTLAVDTASFDITGIPGVYAHLVMMLTVRATGAVTAALCQARFNNDSGANYDYEYIGAHTNTASAVNGLAQTALSLGDCPGASASAGLAASIRTDIPNYAGSVFDKATASQSAFSASTAAADIWSQAVNGHWRVVGAAIARITVLPSSGSFKAGSRCTLYALDVL